MLGVLFWGLKTFFCSLDVLYGTDLVNCNFWSKIFLVIKTLDPVGSGSLLSLKCWIRIKWIQIRNPAFSLSSPLQDWCPGPAVVRTPGWSGLHVRHVPNTHSPHSLTQYRQKIHLHPSIFIPLSLWAHLGKIDALDALMSVLLAEVGFM